MDEKHIKEDEPYVKKQQANMDTPSNGEDGEKQAFVGVVDV